MPTLVIPVKSKYLFREFINRNLVCFLKLVSKSSRAEIFEECAMDESIDGGSIQRKDKVSLPKLIDHDPCDSCCLSRAQTESLDEIIVEFFLELIAVNVVAF